MSALSDLFKYRYTPRTNALTSSDSTHFQSITSPHQNHSPVSSPSHSNYSKHSSNYSSNSGKTSNESSNLVRTPGCPIVITPESCSQNEINESSSYYEICSNKSNYSSENRNNSQNSSIDSMYVHSLSPLSYKIPKKSPHVQASPLSYKTPIQPQPHFSENSHYVKNNISNSSSNKHFSSPPKISSCDINDSNSSMSVNRSSMNKSVESSPNKKSNQIPNNSQSSVNQSPQIDDLLSDQQTGIELYEEPGWNAACGPVLIVDSDGEDISKNTKSASDMPSNSCSSEAVPKEKKISKQLAKPLTGRGAVLVIDSSDSEEDTQHEPSPSWISAKVIPNNPTRPSTIGLKTRFLAEKKNTIIMPSKDIDDPSPEDMIESLKVLYPSLSKRKLQDCLIHAGNEMSATIAEINKRLQKEENTEESVSSAEKIESLKILYPTFEEWQLQDALICAGNDMTAAIGELNSRLKKSQVSVQSQSKRMRQISSSSNEDDASSSINTNRILMSPQCHKASSRKRIRVLSDSSNDGVSPVKNHQNWPYKNGFNNQTSKVLSPSNIDNTSPDSYQQNFIKAMISPQEREESKNLMKLSKAFPKIDMGTISKTLQECNGSLDSSMKMLGAKYTSASENVGSIKAYKAARIQNTSINSELSPIKSRFDDEEESDHRIPSKIEKKTHKNVRKAAPKYIDQSDEEFNDDEFDSSDSEHDKAVHKKVGNIDPILEYVNRAELKDLVAVSGISKKKAEILLTLKPFENLDDMHLKLQQNKLSYLLGSLKELILAQETVDRLMSRCETMTKKMGRIILKLSPSDSIDDANTDGLTITDQPKCLNPDFKLKPYQMIGLNWLVVMDDSKINGILGDEMGLGKTIQTIAFLAHLLDKGEKGPHCIIVPSSTIDNWLRELQNWCPSLKVLLYYGSQDERAEIREDIFSNNIEEFNILVTSYNLATGSTQDRILFKKFDWHYAIFDEGHMLKNMSSSRYQNLMRISAERRLLLTGTPLQNNLIELMSLLAFVMPDFFMGKTDQVKSIFNTVTGATKQDTGTRGYYEKKIIGRAKQILKPFFLRRLKSQVLKQLPQKKHVVKYVEIIEDQREIYDRIVDQYAARLELETPIRSAGITMLMELRKVANHPLLHRKIYTDEVLREMAKKMLREPTHRASNEQYVFEDMQVMTDFELHQLCKNFKGIRSHKLEEELILQSGKFKYLDNILPTLKENGDRVLLFSQFTSMMDIFEKYMEYRSYKYLRLDGSTLVTERQELIDEFTEDEDIFIFLLSTKAGGLGINLTAANIVILHDIDFNPYNDKQAEDRCHRLGQTSDVTIYKLIAKETIEEGILRCAENKLRLEEEVTGTDDLAEENSKDVITLLDEVLKKKSR